MDAFLFKNMRFFDLHEKGQLNKLDFFKAIAKCGVVIDTYVHLSWRRTWTLSGISMLLRMVRSTTKNSYNNCFSDRTRLNQIRVDSKQVTSSLLNLFKKTMTIKVRYRVVLSSRVKTSWRNRRYKVCTVNVRHTERWWTSQKENCSNLVQAVC